MRFKTLTVALFLSTSMVSYADSTTTQSTQETTSMSSTQSTTKLSPGEAFLQANKTKPGVVALPSGLQYKVIKAGTGPKPTEKDTVTVEYKGSLIDGTVFDSSAKHGGSIQFPLGQVIPGWVEALKLMPVGSTWEVYIPANLAYGERGAPPSIGPNQTLIFEVTLVDFK